MRYDRRIRSYYVRNLYSIWVRGTWHSRDLPPAWPKRRREPCRLAMMNLQLGQLLEQIYGAATGEGPWSAFLNSLALVVPNGRASLYVLHETGYGSAPAFEWLGA